MPDDQVQMVQMVQMDQMVTSGQWHLMVVNGRQWLSISAKSLVDSERDIIRVERSL